MLTTSSWAVTSLTLWRAGTPPSSQTGAEQRERVTRARLSSTQRPVTRLTITGCLKYNVRTITEQFECTYLTRMLKLSLAVRHVKVFMTKLVTAPTAVRMMIIPLPSMMTSARDRIQIRIVSRDRILIANAMVKHAQIVSHNFIIKLYYKFIIL